MQKQLTKRNRTNSRACLPVTNGYAGTQNVGNELVFYCHSRLFLLLWALSTAVMWMIKWFHQYLYCHQTSTVVRGRFPAINEIIHSFCAFTSVLRHGLMTGRASGL